MQLTRLVVPTISALLIFSASAEKLDLSSQQNASNAVVRAKVKIIKASNAYTAMTNQLAQYQGHYDSLTNLIATSNLTQTNKVQQIFQKQVQALDDCHDALTKATKVLMDFIKSQP